MAKHQSDGSTDRVWPQATHSDSESRKLQCSQSSYNNDTHITANGTSYWWPNTYYAHLVENQHIPLRPTIYLMKRCYWVHIKIFVFQVFFDLLVSVVNKKRVFYIFILSAIIYKIISYKNNNFTFCSLCNKKKTISLYYMKL